MGDAILLHSIDGTRLDDALNGTRGRNRRAPRTGRYVAVIGSGAAGLAAADALNHAGHFVTIFERAPQAGGRLRESIPQIPAADGVLDRYLILLAGDGVVFRTRVHIGVDLPIDWLYDDYNAVVVTVGAVDGPESRRLFAGLDLRRTPDGSPWRDEQGRTSAAGIFLASRPSGVEDVITSAIAEGHRVASAVDLYLR